ncbi:MULTISPECIES: ribosome small subunit-dependent GTPase A [unclassified Clostridium]|uniref:ribosome small subunit-dependent GTPase A n=1 Tax=Clostridia TaxID=186801 RepID=UPI0014856643|nr:MULTISPECIES: ribosome small subunit-dependent GTPase A [unclassified Clostridium]
MPVQEDQLKNGIILQGIGGYYEVLDAAGQVHTCNARGKLRQEVGKPLTGDHVSFLPAKDQQNGRIEHISPRKNQLVRPPAANIDQMIVVITAGVPAADLLLLDRLLIQAEQWEMEAVLCINKCDMDEDGRVEEGIRREYAATGYPVLSVSAKNAEGIDNITARLKGKVTCFAGQSGVGKSSLINLLLPGEEMETGGLSKKLARGRHTTRRTQLLRAGPDTFIMDTPGFSLFETNIGTPELLQEYYPEYRPYQGQCRFNGCLHDREPDCAVRQAVARGELARGRHERYRTLLSEAREQWRRQYD